VLTSIERRLVTAHAAAFFGVLLVFSLVIYQYFSASLYAQERSHLTELADSIISSIDIDASGEPDTIDSALPESASQSLNRTRLQWFDKSGELSSEKGYLTVNVPFVRDDGFVEQKTPHALLLTRAAVSDNRLLGYVRVALPLDKVDEAQTQLLLGLLAGGLAAAALSVLGIAWLVRQSMRPIEEHVNKMRQFTADASHEFKTPLMVIKTNTAVALKYPDGMRDQDREKFSMISDACQQMDRLSEDLLTLARRDDGSKPDMAALTDLGGVIEERLKPWREQPSFGNLKLTVEKDDDLLVRGDPDDMRKIFGNLIDNAFQYTPGGGEVHVSLKSELGQAVVTISDTGIGIDPDNHERVFDRFWRSDAARSRRQAGNGLGLSIARAMVESYGGKISLASELGRGAQFTVRLPLANTRSPSHSHARAASIDANRFDQTDEGAIAASDTTQANGEG